MKTTRLLLTAIAFVMNIAPVFAQVQSQQCANVAGNWVSEFQLHRKVLEIRQISCTSLSVIDHRRTEGDIVYFLLLNGNTVNTVPTFFINRKNQQLRGTGLQLQSMNITGSLEYASQWYSRYRARVTSDLLFSNISLTIEADINIDAHSHNGILPRNYDRIYFNPQSIRITRMSVPGSPVSSGIMMYGANLVLRFMPSMTRFFLSPQ